MDKMEFNVYESLRSDGVKRCMKRFLSLNIIADKEEMDIIQLKILKALSESDIKTDGQSEYICESI